MKKYLWAILILALTGGIVSAQQKLSTPDEERYERIFSTPQDLLSDEDLLLFYDFLNLTAYSYYSENGEFKSVLTEKDFTDHGIPLYFYRKLQETLVNNNESMRQLGMSPDNYPSEKPAVKTPEQMKADRIVLYPDRLLTPQEREIRDKLAALDPSAAQYLDGDRISTRLTAKDLRDAGIPECYFDAIQREIELNNNYMKLYHPEREERIEAIRERLVSGNSSAE